MLLYMLLGGLLGRLGWMDDDLVRRLSKLNFRVFMAVTVFSSLWAGQLEQFRGGLFLFEALFVVLLLASSSLLIRSKDPLRKPVYLQSLFRGNIQTFTMAILPAMDPKFQPVALLNCLLVAACFNVPSMLLFNRERSPKALARRVLLTPVVLAAAAGVALSLSGLPQPTAVAAFSSGVSSMVVPLSFLCTGASLRLSTARQNLGPVALCSAGRLLLVPLAGYALALLLGFRGVDLLLLFPFFASPCGSACHTIACDAGADSGLAAGIVAVTQLLAPFTILLWYSLAGPWLGL